MLLFQQQLCATATCLPMRFLFVPSFFNTVKLMLVEFTLSGHMEVIFHSCQWLFKTKVSPIVVFHASKFTNPGTCTIAYLIIVHPLINVHPTKIQKKNRTPSLIIVHPINKTKIISLKTVYKNRTPCNL